MYFLLGTIMLSLKGESFCPALYVISGLFSVQVNVSSAVLKASAHHYGSQCDKANKEFMLCRWEEKDPRKCLQEGMKVNECALNFFRYLTLLPVFPDFSFLKSLRYVLIMSTLYLWSNLHFKKIKNRNSFEFSSVFIVLKWPIQWC